MDKENVIIMIIGFFLALIIDFGLDKSNWIKKSSWLDKSKGWRKIAIAVIGIILGGIFPLIYQMPTIFKDYSNSLNLIDENLNNSNVIYATKSDISNIENKKVKEFFNNGLLKYEDKIEKIKKEKILHIEKNDVFNIWRKIISTSESGDKLYATNIVSYNEWGEFDISKGESLQKEAISRQVEITRVYLFDDKVIGHVEGTEKLFTRDIKNNINAFKMNVQLAKKGRFDEKLEKLKTIDMLLLNDELLLLTFTRDKDHKVKYSYLTYDKELIRIAKGYFDELLKDVNVK